MPMSAIGKSIHSSAEIRPSSLIPSVRSAEPQMGIAARVKSAHTAICIQTGSCVVR